MKLFNVFLQVKINTFLPIHTQKNRLYALYSFFMGFFFSENRSFDGLSKLMSDAKSIHCLCAGAILKNQRDCFQSCFLVTDNRLRDIHNCMFIDDDPNSCFFFAGPTNRSNL